MRVNERMKKVFCILLCLCMLVQNCPVVAFAAELDNLCEHHAEHTAECGYVEGVSDCTHYCDICLGHDHGEEEKEEQETTAPFSEATEPSEESDVIANQSADWCGNPLCSQEDAFHVTSCAQYVAPENPVCKCAEKCTEVNEWCDVCGVDYTKCGGTDTAAQYAEGDDNTGDTNTEPINLMVAGNIADGSQNVTINEDGSWTISGNISIAPNVTFNYNDIPYIQQNIAGTVPFSITLLDRGDYGDHWINLYNNWVGPNEYPAGTHHVRTDSLKSVYDWNVQNNSWGNTGTATIRAIYFEFNGTGTVTLKNLSLSAENTTVGTASHTFDADGKCIICGYECTHTIDITTGKCVCGAEMTVIATVTDGSTTLYAADAATLNTATAKLLAAGATNIIVNLPTKASVDMFLAIRSALVDTEGVVDGSINLTLAGCTEIPVYYSPEWSGIFGDYTEGVSELRSVTLPNVVTIGESAFYGASNLSSVDAPKATSVGETAFACTALSVVSMPCVESVGERAFMSCKKLTNITLPSAETIGKYAFFLCNNLKVITLPKATTLGQYAFQECNDLSELTLGAITSVDRDAFNDNNIPKNIALTLPAEQKVLTKGNDNYWRPDGDNPYIESDDYKNKAFIGHTFKEIKIIFSVSVSEIENGTVTADKATALTGDTVTLTATPAAGYQFGSWAVTDANGTLVTVENNQFTMPASNVTVSAVFITCAHTDGTLSDYVPTEDGTQHVATYDCCGAVVTEDHTFDENGRCVCGSECSHEEYIDGKCTACGANLCDHSGSQHTTATNNGDGTHSFTCTVCGDTATENHTGGTATCQARATCDKCGTAYGEIDSGNHTGAEFTYTASGDTITASCGGCQKVVGTIQLKDPENLTYDGEAKVVTVTQSPKGIFTDVPTQITGDWINAGEHTASLTYGGVTANLDFTIQPIMLDENDFSFSITSKVYDGDTSARLVAANMNWSANTKILWEDQQVISVEMTAFYDSPDVGEGKTITISNIVLKHVGSNYLLPENYSFEISGSITPKEVTDPTFAGMEETYQYNGAPVQPTFKLMDGDMQIPENEYTVTYTNNTEAGTATITITDNEGGNYTVSGSTTFQIVVHEHIWTYTASGNTITATCEGTIGTCPNQTITYKLVIPTGLDFNSGGKTASCEITPADASGVAGVGFSYKPMSDNAQLSSTTGLPQNAGDYEVTMLVDDAATVTGKLTIAPAQISQNPTYTKEGVYTGKAHAPSVSIRYCRATYDYTETYSADMTNAGQKTITITGIGNYTGSYELTYTIVPKKVTITGTEIEAVTYDPNGYTLTVTGVTFDGVVEGETLDYSATAELKGTNGVGTQGTEVTVTLNNSNYVLEQATVLGKVTINKAASSITTAPTAKILTYNGKAQELVMSGSTTDGTILFSLEENGEYSTSIPTRTNASDYTVWYYVQGDENHSNTEATSIPVTIAQKELTPAVSGSVTKVYNGTTDVPDNHNLAISVSGIVSNDNVTVTASFAYDGADVGTTKINATGITLGGVDAGNYKLKSTTASADVGEIIKADPIYKAPTVAAPRYNGNAQALISGGSVTGGKFQYSLDNQNWSDNIPTGKNAGNYIVYYKIVGDSNHNDNDGGTVPVTIGKRDVTITAKDQSITYGESISGTEITAAGLVDGHSVTVTLTPSTANVTVSGTITASAAVITEGTTDVTGNYNVSYTSGNLVIEPDTSKIDALTTENVTSANEADIKAVQEMMENANSIKEEWAAITATCEDMIEKIEAVEVENARIADAVSKFDLTTVKSSDEAAITALIADIDEQLATNNLTDAERSELENLKTKCNNLIAKIDGTETLIGQLDKTVDDLDAETVKSTDKAALEQVIADAQTLIDSSNVTEAEKEALVKTQEDAQALIKVIDDTAAVNKALTDQAATFDEDAVKSTDKTELEQLAQDIKDLLDTQNLTEDERTALETVLEQVEDMIDTINETAEDSKAATDTIDALDPATVTSDDKDELEDAIAIIDELLKDDHLTEDERKALEDAKADAEALIDVIDAAQDATDTENTEKVEDVTAENVKPEEKEALENAKADLEKALEDNAGNYTEEEKKLIQDEIQRIEDAMVALENVEDVTEAIKDLPKTVEPDDEETAEKILNAKEAYDELTDHEKSLVDENTKKKLDDLVAALTAYDIIKGDGGKWTKGSSSGLSFTANGPFSKFVGVEVDGKEVASTYYTAESGSTIITLKQFFLKRLSTGEHTITVLYTDGETSGTFKILAASSTPATGDNSNIMLWSGMLCVSTLGLVALLADRKRRRSAK